MLLRMASAVVLAAVAITATLASIWSFLVLVLAASVAMAWEWGRLIRGTGQDTVALVQIVSVAAAAILVVIGHAQYGLSLLATAIVAIAVTDKPRERALWSSAGVAYAGLPVTALLWIRGDEALGAIAIIFVLVIAWTTDTVSYAAGMLGGPKLAPRISPKKTWSGFIIGSVTPALIGYAFAYGVTGTSAWRLALLSIVLALACQFGDLMESAVKRRFGTKDMSQLIPGHGGLLDRIDGFLLAAAIAGLIALRDPANPASGLLIW
ncbi:MAG: phosphatidate cytidylyltransferase [Methyloceanibacter sp.]